MILIFIKLCKPYEYDRTVLRTEFRRIKYFYFPLFKVIIHEERGTQYKLYSKRAATQASPCCAIPGPCRERTISLGSHWDIRSSATATLHLLQCPEDQPPQRHHYPSTPAGSPHTLLSYHEPSDPAACKFNDPAHDPPLPWPSCEGFPPPSAEQIPAPPVRAYAPQKSASGQSEEPGCGCAPGCAEKFPQQIWTDTFSPARSSDSAFPAIQRPCSPPHCTTTPGNSTPFFVLRSSA